MRRLDRLLMLLVVLAISACGTREPEATSEEASTVAVSGGSNASFAATDVERRYLFIGQREAQWVNYSLFLYLLMETDVRRDKQDAALRSYVACVESIDIANSAPANGVFIVPIRLSATRGSPPKSSKEQVAWAEYYFDHARSRTMIEAIELQKRHLTNNSSRRKLFLVIANGPLAAHPRAVAAYDLSNVDAAGIAQFIDHTLDDVRSGHAHTTLDIERRSATFANLLPALGRNFGSVVYAVKDLIVQPANAASTAITCGQ